ncbi:hypothetical protein AALP_AA4G179400 [Arabis alpina]|uniref:Membrane lipoprotein n=1 Tax=Arabis alpina TaxID=50452 RepID=A0A087H3Z4_ARAAL|nr:hypothetical protein AALP_AA4G179400 [Arabis alpina]
MRSLSSIGLALSIVFGCLLLALLAELYYLLWCKKKRRPDLSNDYSTPQSRKLLFIFCCNTTTTTNPSSPSFSNPKPIETQQQHQQCLTLGNEFENVGPGLVPRFLFTIMEETVEEMESEDGVSNKGKSLNDLFLNIESGGTSTTPPYLTPLASPSLFTPPFTPIMDQSCNGKKEEISSFFELSTDAEFNRLVRSSPLSSHSSPSSSSSPLPRFKFLRDAEEKLYKRKVMEIVEAEELKD